ncbi:unnamed protein product, partial [Laminaria digitata]
QVASLLKAKHKYKEVTGNDYAPPPQEKKPKPTPKDAAPSTSGPSKNASKKADKASKKAASKKAPSKNAKSPPPAGTPPAASTSAAPPLRAVGRSTPSMYLNSDGPGPLKCVTAAKFFGVKVEAADINPAGELSRASGCALAAGGSVIFGSNAICRYFSYKGTSSSTKGKGADLGAVEEWLEWEAVTLAPAERLLAASEQGGGSAPPEALAALKHLEGKMTGTWLIEGGAPSLADLVVGVTAQAAIAWLGSGKAASAFPKVQSYLQRFEKIEACTQAASDLGTFTKASQRP